jgi:hypothetical protein
LDGHDDAQQSSEREEYKAGEGELWRAAAIRQRQIRGLFFDVHVVRLESSDQRASTWFRGLFHCFKSVGLAVNRRSLKVALFELQSTAGKPQARNLETGVFSEECLT